MRMQLPNALVDRRRRPNGSGFARRPSASLASQRARRAGELVRGRVAADVPRLVAWARLVEAHARHWLVVRGRKLALVSAEAAHKVALWRATRALHRTERRAARAADAARARAASPSLLGRFGAVELHADHVRTPEWVAPLDGGVRARLVPGAERPSGALWQRGVSARRDRRGTLLLEAGPLTYACPCAPDDRAAAEFVRLVNVAALNAGRLAGERRSAEADAERRAREAEEAWRGRIEAARARLEHARDRSVIERRRSLLRDAERDVAEIEARRDALARLGGRGPASRPG